jgi:hypothetical protein
MDHINWTQVVVTLVGVFIQIAIVGASFSARMTRIETHLGIGENMPPIVERVRQLELAASARGRARQKA